MLCSIFSSRCPSIKRSWERGLFKLLSWTDWVIQSPVQVLALEAATYAPKPPSHKSTRMLGRVFPCTEWPVTANPGWIGTWWWDNLIFWLEPSISWMYVVVNDHITERIGKWLCGNPSSWMGLSGNSTIAQKQCVRPCVDNFTSIFRTNPCELFTNLRSVDKLHVWRMTGIPTKRGTKPGSAPWFFEEEKFIWRICSVSERVRECCVDGGYLLQHIK